MRRRTFCSRVLAGGAGTTAVGAVVSRSVRATESNVSGYVSTRGHFEVEGWDTAVLTDGHTPTSYEVSGTIPGYDRESPNELLLFVHDFHRDEETALNEFDTAADNLASLGIEAPFVGYNWDSHIHPLKWHGAVDAARRNGEKLGAFLETVRAQSPGTTLRVVGHGLGCHIVLATLLAVSDGTTVDSFDMLGPAVHPTAASFEAEGDRTAYAPALEAHVDDVHNYYKMDDLELGIDVLLMEGYWALGLFGAEGETASNYAEHDVTFDVDRHGTFFHVEDGCLDDVVDQW